MRWMVASDIHGSALWCRRLLEAFDREQPDRLLLLGDLLYHGPRNDLPEAYAPKEVFAMLNERSGRLLGVRGNCDAEIDQLVLQFPMSADSMLLGAGKRLFFVTHGHLFDRGHLPPLHAGDVFLQGHTHVPSCETLENGVVLMNPGSVSLPKNGSESAYMLIDDRTVEWKSLSGAVWMRYEL
ncbi:MAG: phosphodiesterase [Oscillospiraceae bacterium]|nr:phosphodiesterase [Oscillospiraceae bacterium]